MYLTAHEWEGVWVSNVPLDSNEGAEGDVLLLIRLDPSEVELADFEWVEEGKTYREWLVPAAVLNRYGAVSEADLLP
jgi:hypothetical protein